MTDSFESTVDKATAWLDQLGSRLGQPSFTDADAHQALAELLGWVVALNASSTAIEREELSDDVVDKLRRWIERLLEQLKTLARRVGARSFSVTAGGRPPSVSVTVVFGGG
jgi:hypothetical protein